MLNVLDFVVIYTVNSAVNHSAATVHGKVTNLLTSVCKHVNDSLATPHHTKVAIFAYCNTKLF